jgi:eukaryotic-like serine/threonine-protein kinase
MAFAAGDKLGPYEILSLIGAGGMGEVCKARDTRLGRTVAIKRLARQYDAGLMREARAIAKLNHPGICTLHDIGPDYLVMEYIEGEPIVSRKKPGPLPLTDAWRFAMQIAEALEAAHTKQIIHLDLKPDNILVTSSGAVKVLDFGLARLSRSDANPLAGESGDGAALSATSSIAEIVSGTPGYMSPEQAQGKPLDARSDIFSFGAVLYEMLAGRRPFRCDSLAAALIAVVRDEPPPLSAPPEWERIVCKCLRKEPAQRFQSMREVREALSALSPSAEAPKQQPSVAVLPFANMSSDPEQEYFSDGLAEEIINALTQIPGLKVIARTSAFAFKGKHEDVRRIAEVLGVRHVLEGSVRKAGNRVRITAQLIQASDGGHVWSERYDRELTDIFAVQDEIAAAIARKLQVNLDTAATSTPQHTPSMPAYEAVLKGRHIMMKQTPDAALRAKEYFDRAAALDASYVEPHAALAHYYGLGSIQGIGAAHDFMPRLKSEALQVLEIDPGDARGHILLGTFHCLFEYAWREGEERFRRGMSSARLSGDAYAWYGACWLMPLGHYARRQSNSKRRSRSTL